MIKVGQHSFAVGSAAKSDLRRAVDALVHAGRIACIRAQSGVLLEYHSWGFMIAFPHATPSTSNAPGPYVKWPVPAAVWLS